MLAIRLTRRVDAPPVGAVLWLSNRPARKQDEISEPKRPFSHFWRIVIFGRRLAGFESQSPAFLKSGTLRVVLAIVVTSDPRYGKTDRACARRSNTLHACQERLLPSFNCMAKQPKTLDFTIQWRDNTTGDMAYKTEDCQAHTVEEANKKVEELRKQFPTREYRVVPPDMAA